MITAAPSSVTLPIQTSACSAGTSCVGTADEIRTTLTYGSTGVANNLNVTAISQGSGTSPSMSVTAMTHTVNGDVATVDGPLSGTADTTRILHDDLRRVVGVIGPDPDGTGSLPNRAQKTTYDTRGLVTQTQTGTTAGQSDTAWAGFTPAITINAGYDSLGRQVLVEQASGGSTPISQQQWSYDAAGRVSCTTIRMNPTSSPPSDACTATTPGAHGPDRIAQYAYDRAGRITHVTTAAGLTEASTEVKTYTPNGQVASLTDGNGNVSAIEYDGHDRPVTLLYPSPTTPGVTSTTDYEAVTYDKAGNVLTSRNRAGQTTALTYDHLQRPTLIDAPSGTMDVTLTYDNLGRVTSLAGAGQTVSRNWDPLSRMIAEAGPLGTMGYQYDAAGRMTKITWPDAFFADYEHDVTGAITAIRENGAMSGPGVLATYAYTTLGQLSTITRGNGVGTTYGYDTHGRMTSMAHGGTANVAFGYGYNPAGQIVSRTVSDSAYVLAPGPGTTTYANDGLNRVTSVGGTAVTYDSDQNVASALGSSYGYDAANRLTSATIGSSGYTFTYDPAGRLYSASGGSFQYVGQQLVGEYNSSGVLTARHIPGPGLDMPVASRFTGVPGVQQIADERGSVIATIDASGVVNVNRYDEYGVASAANRFQYTGQAYLAPGLYHYRARAYAPQLGRFLQPDPIGYRAGMNVYGYVGGDPTNQIDPSGLCRLTMVDRLNGVTCVDDIEVVGRRPAQDPCPPGTVPAPMGLCMPVRPEFRPVGPPAEESWVAPANQLPDGCREYEWGDRGYTPGGRVRYRGSNQRRLGAEQRAGTARQQNRRANGQFGRGFRPGTRGSFAAWGEFSMYVHLFEYEDQYNPSPFPNRETWTVPGDGRWYYDYLPGDGYEIQFGGDAIAPLPGENSNIAVTVCFLGT